MLEVQFAGLEDFTGGTYAYRINVESDMVYHNIASTPLGGTITVWDFDAGVWVKVVPPDGNPAHAIQYGFNTSDFTSRESMLLRRDGSQRFVSSEALGDMWNAQPLPDGHMIVRLLHASAALRAFTSEYDLVQVIPLVPPVGEGQSSFTTAPLPVSDVNFDGVINDADVDDFLTGWFEEAPVADIDMSTAIDQADVDAFVEAYISGQ